MDRWLVCIVRGRIALACGVIVAVVTSAAIGGAVRAQAVAGEEKSAAEATEPKVHEKKPGEDDEQAKEGDVVDREADAAAAHAEARVKAKREAKEEKVEAHGDKKEKSDATADKSKADAKPDDEKKDAKDSSKEAPKPSVTHGTVTIGGEEIAYTATAGKMLMKTDDGEEKASVFFVAYTRDGAKGAKAEGKAKKVDENEEQEGEEDNDGDKDKSDDAVDTTRPVTFCFNGGPGSASVWLHLGMLGPKRVKLDSHGKTLPPPHELVPNEFSLLDVTDLVFIDPVSTGFSRPAKGQNKNQFHGYDEDVRSVGQFIHDYTTKYGRWGSPKFIIGESYGGLRAAGLSGELQQRYNMYLNGIVMVSAVVDFQTLMAYGHNDVAYALFLPSYSATAWYHKALGEDLQKQPMRDVVKAAEEFAGGAYLRALMAGDSLTKERRKEIVARYAELTGLSPKYVDDSNLRVPMQRFGKELLRKDGRIVGRFDGRYLGIALDRIDDAADYDPSASAVMGTFTSALNDYLRRTLEVKEDRVYEILTDQVHPWDYSEFTNRYVDASNTLRSAMTENPHLRVFAACGYYDLATPAFAMKYTRDHLNLAPELRDHFVLDYYEGGHMMYAHEPSLKKLRKDLLKFYEATLADDAAEER